MKKKLGAALLVVALVLSFGLAPASAATFNFSDDFEAATIDPFWTVREDFGTVELSSEQAHSGSQSTKFSSISGNQRNIGLRHQFPEVMKGSVSVWFYDTKAGQVGLYAFLDIFNTTLPWGEPGFRFQVGVADWDPTWYYASDGITVIKPSVRTVGWHEFKIVYNSGNVQIFLDGTQVASFAGDFGFDSVGIGVWGPSYRPNATFYWDDFNVEAYPALVTGVSIGIKPGSDPNSINLKGKGVIPVGILTTPDFDATTVDASTVTFGPGAATMVHKNAHLEDVDGDGDIDMVLHFRTQDTGIMPGDIEACLEGTTLGGTPIQGCDSVRTVPG